MNMTISKDLAATLNFEGVGEGALGRYGFVQNDGSGRAGVFT